MKILNRAETCKLESLSVRDSCSLVVGRKIEMQQIELSIFKIVAEDSFL